MAKTLIERQEDGTIKLTITLPEKEVKVAYEEVLASHAKDANIAGFRKGKAPQNLVEDKLNKEHIREDVLKKILPQAYMSAVEEHKIRPIMNPKMHVETIEEGKDWVVNALTCELPEIKTGDYKKKVQAVTAKSKIVVPGKEAEKPTMDQIVKAVLETSTVKVPGVLVEQETDRLLSQLLSDIKRLGLNLEQYLASTNRTGEDLRAEYAKRATEDIKLEFVLQKIAEEEKVAVDEKEVEEAIQKAQSPEEKAHLESNKYLLASILRQQKTLDFLMNL